MEGCIYIYNVYKTNLNDIYLHIKQELIIENETMAKRQQKKKRQISKYIYDKYVYI